MKYIIITGASKGLGKALAEELTNVNTTLILISRDRKALEELNGLIEKKGSKAYLYIFDLYYYDQLEKLMDDIVTSIIKEPCNSIIFINNASIINPIDRFDRLAPKDIQSNLNINCISPILLINYFLSKTSYLNVERRIINISSGAINNSICGWALYSASKSAVHSIIETLSKENHNSHLLKVVSFDPGVMDTNMQKNIRSVTEDQFPDIETFKGFYRNNELRSTKDVASIINEVYIDHWYAKKTFEKISEYE